MWRQIEEALGEIDRRWSIKFSKLKQKGVTSIMRASSSQPAATFGLRERKNIDSQGKNYLKMRKFYFLLGEERDLLMKERSVMVDFL